MKKDMKNKTRQLSGVNFAKEWIKACHYKVDDGSLSLKDYIAMLKNKIINLTPISR